MSPRENWVSITPYSQAARGAAKDTALLDVLAFLRQKVRMVWGVLCGVAGKNSALLDFSPPPPPCRAAFEKENRKRLQGMPLPIDAISKHYDNIFP